MLKSLRKLLYTIILTLSLISLPMVATTSFGQSAGATTASLTGQLRDPQDAAINGAQITVKNLATNAIREQISLEDGSFLVNQLAPGNYEVMVKAPGFATTATHFDLILGTTKLINLTLSISTTTEIIEVQANSVLSDGKTESSTNIEQRSIEDLPINRRNFLDFAATSARVVKDNQDIGATATSGLSINGQSGRFNNVTIDGLDNNDSGSGSVRATFSQDAVREFQIISDNYSAEFGRALGGVINIVTRGGSNEYHSSLFLFNRNDSTSARDPFSKINPEYRQYQFGATLGGSLKKDKAFFFTSFERLSIKQNTLVTISDAVVTAAKNVGFNNVQNGPIPFAIGTTNLLARLDLRINPNDNLFIRYNGGFSYNGGFDNFGGLDAASNSGVQKLDDNSLVVSNTYVASNGRFINESRFLFTTRQQKDLPIDPIGPQVRLANPEGSVTFGRSSFLPQPRDQRFYQFVDNVSLPRGRNQIKFGVDIFAIRPPKGRSALPFVPGGLATFSPIDYAALLNRPDLPAFTALQNFDPSLRTPAQQAFLGLLALGLPIIDPTFPRGVDLTKLSIPTGFTQGFGSTIIAVPATFFATFIQDDIKLRPNLLIKAGLRYDLDRSSGLPDNNGNFSPRVAFSYSPKRLKDVNLHGSYGLFFAVPVTGVGAGVGLLDTGKLKIPLIPFPLSIIAFAQPGHRFANEQNFPSSLTFVPQLSQSFQYQPDIRNSYTQQVNFGINYVLKSNILLSLDYNYVRGLKLFSTRDINPVVRQVGNVVQNLLQGRLDPTKGDIFQFSSIFDSYFHSFTISATRRFANKFSLLAHYTVAKNIDDTFDFNTISREVVDPLNPRAERSLAAQDIRRRFVLSGVWDLSYTKNRFLTGFQLSSIITLNSGKPYNLLAGVDLNKSGDNPPGDRPLVGGVSLSRNAGIAPGFANVDMRLTRTINIKERYKIEGFVEAFNLFNRVNIDPATASRFFMPDSQGNFNLPRQKNGRYILTPDRFQTAFAPRQIQVGFRLSF